MRSQMNKALVAGLLMLGLALSPTRVSAKPIATAARPVIIDLGTLGGFDSFAHDINELGQIVGASETTAGKPGYQAFLWDKGALTALEVSSGSTAFRISESGQVTGFFSSSQPVVYHSFLWEKGTTTELGDWAVQAAQAAAPMP